MKYKLLLNILEKICEQAPEKYKSYKGNSEEEKNKAFSKAYIHLYLKVKFGINSFVKRHEFITDGSLDGGLDAYYIDYENRMIYLIQSKFRTTEQNFEKKEITIDELVKMETDRIIKGEKESLNGEEYNSKIKDFQNKLKSINDIARYDYEIVILGNLKKYKAEQIQPIIGMLPFEVFDYNKTYNELVYPVCISTYYNEKDIDIKIELNQKSVNYLLETFNTSFGECDVTILFLPVKEIGKAMSKYKNSLLKYNPRNYLTLSKNKVNKDIRSSILENEFADFAILNNGITLLCDEVNISDKTGKKNNSQVIIKNPQFINGGQTSYTLSKILESEDSNKLTDDKKVMLKIITLNCEEENNQDQYIGFIENISNATNKQTKVEEADRRANERLHIELQKFLYENYSLFYERKSGEYESAIFDGYLSKDHIIKRTDFLRSALAYKGQPEKARSSSGEKLFESKMFNYILDSKNEFDNFMIAYKVFYYLDKKIKSNEKDYGEGLRYGKYAVVYVACKFIKIKNIEINNYNIDEIIKKETKLVLEDWKDFEKYAVLKESNANYFGGGKVEYLNYYKNNKLKHDLDYFYFEDICLNEVAATKEN